MARSEAPHGRGASGSVASVESHSVTVRSKLMLFVEYCAGRDGPVELCDVKTPLPCPWRGRVGWKYVPRGPRSPLTNVKLPGRSTRDQDHITVTRHSLVSTSRSRILFCSTRDHTVSSRLSISNPIMYGFSHPDAHCPHWAVRAQTPRCELFTCPRLAFYSYVLDSRSHRSRRDSRVDARPSRDRVRSRCASQDATTALAPRQRTDAEAYTITRAGLAQSGSSSVTDGRCRD